MYGTKLSTVTMQTVNIDISTSASVLERVRLETGYAAKKDDPNGDSFEQIGAVEDDAQILMTYYGDAVKDVVSALAGKVSGLTDTSLTLSLSGGWDAGLRSSLESCINEYLFSRVCSRWMRLVKDGEESKYSADSEASMSKVREIACYKKRFSRPGK